MTGQQQQQLAIGFLVPIKQVVLVPCYFSRCPFFQCDFPVAWLAIFPEGKDRNRCHRFDNREPKGLGCTPRKRMENANAKEG